MKNGCLEVFLHMTKLRPTTYIMLNTTSKERSKYQVAQENGEMPEIQVNRTILLRYTVLHLFCDGPRVVFAYIYDARPSHSSELLER